MSRLIKTFVGAMACVCASAAVAGPKTDAFASCLSDSTTGRDRKIMIRWIVAMIDSHPALGDLAPAELQNAQLQTSKQAGVLLTRLLTVDCAQAGKAAVAADGPNAFQTAFQTFGRVAAIEMMAAPEVQASINELGNYVDQDRLKATYDTK